MAIDGVWSYWKCCQKAGVMSLSRETEALPATGKRAHKIAPRDLPDEAQRPLPEMSKGRPVQASYTASSNVATSTPPIACQMLGTTAR